MTAATGPQDFYTLDALYLAWSLQHASAADYTRQARENGLNIGFVSVAARKKVVDWLEGKGSESDMIVPAAGEFLSFIYSETVNFISYRRNDYTTGNTTTTLK